MKQIQPKHKQPALNFDSLFGLVGLLTLRLKGPLDQYDIYLYNDRNGALFGPIKVFNSRGLRPLLTLVRHIQDKETIPFFPSFYRLANSFSTNLTASRRASCNAIMTIIPFA